MAESRTPQEFLQRFAQGEIFDWQGRPVAAEALSEIVRSAARTEGAPTTLGLRNARIAGHIVLDAVGRSQRQIALTLNSCDVQGGLHARGSSWLQFSILSSTLQFVDMPRSSFVLDLVIGEVQAGGWLELRGSEVGKALVLAGSSFKQGNHDAAIELSGAIVGMDLDARRLRTKGEIAAERIRIMGDLRLEGALIAASDPSQTSMNLNHARIGGRVRMEAAAPNERFSSQGIIQMMSAQIGTLEMRGAKLAASENPALVGDQLNVTDTVDFGGASDREGPAFEAKGQIRLVAATVGRQLQACDGRFSGEDGFALKFESAVIGGDVIIGRPNVTTWFDGGVSADSARIGGRLMINQAKLSGKTAASFMHTQIRGDVIIYDTEAKGPLLFGKMDAHGLLIDQLAISPSSREDLPADLPENYSHESDALLDLNFCDLTTNIHANQLSISDGDMRMNGSRIGGGLQLHRLKALGRNGRAIMAQGARIDGSITLVGTRETHALVRGEINFMGAKVADSITLIDVDIKPDNGSSALLLRGAAVGGVCNFVRLALEGELNLSAAVFEQDVILFSTRLKALDRTALDMRGATVRGLVQFAPFDTSSDEPTELAGQVLGDGAHIGELRWQELSIADGSEILLSNMTIDRALLAGTLSCTGKGLLDLSGTSVPQLTDRLDTQSDSWGAGAMTLRLDGFRYDRLTYPAGGFEESARNIRHWRTKWLRRAVSPQSPRAARQLSAVLRKQGLHESSRLILIDAFAEEARYSNAIERALSRAWGALFGHGLSGYRAFTTLMIFWLFGAWSTGCLQRADLLVDVSTAGHYGGSCGDLVDPFIYSADVMLPLLDLGEEKKCEIGMGPRAASEPVVHGYALWQTLRFLQAVYAVFGWMFVSLAIATWAGVYRWSGHE